MNWKTEGFSEAGIGVRNPDGWIDFLREIGGWRVIHQGETAAASVAAWPGMEGAEVHETLLERPEFGRGRIRLFHFDSPLQEPNRSGALPWDTGGFFDLDLRVDDMASVHAAMTAAGWDSLSGPVEWDFGGLQVIEWLARGPEDVILALIQRLDPPLDTGLEGPGFGHVFNASQTVRDMDRALTFYRALGFEQMMRHQGPLAGRGGEVLCLDPEEAPSTHVDLAIVHPSGVMDGAIELFNLPSRPGRDLSALAQPHGYGLNLLRIPVTGCLALAEHLDAQSIMMQTEPFETWLEPHGAVRQLNLRSPDGAWLECFEVIE